MGEFVSGALTDVAAYIENQDFVCEIDLVPMKRVKPRLELFSFLSGKTCQEAVFASWREGNREDDMSGERFLQIARLKLFLKPRRAAQADDLGSGGHPNLHRYRAGAQGPDR
jgi:hypothetical protein